MLTPEEQRFIEQVKRILRFGHYKADLSYGDAEQSVKNYLDVTPGPMFRGHRSTFGRMWRHYYGEHRRNRGGPTADENFRDFLKYPPTKAIILPFIEDLTVKLEGVKDVPGYNEAPSTVQSVLDHMYIGRGKYQLD